MKDKRNRHGTVGKSSSEQHFHKSAAITFIVWPSGWLADELAVGRNIQLTKVQHHYSLTNAGFSESENLLQG